MPFFHDFFVEQKSLEELAKNSNYDEILKYQFQNDMYYGLHHYKYFQNLNQVNILTAYKEANCPVLTLAGEFDIHAINTDWAKEIASAVNFYRPDDGSFKIIPKTTHHYHTVESIAEYNHLRKEKLLDNKYISEHYNPMIANSVVEWIKG